MCAYHSAKKKFTRKEIVDILKRNVELYNNEPGFASYIVDLAMYLVEYTYEREPDLAAIASQQVSLTSSGSQKVYKVFRSPTDTNTEKRCPFCGAPTFSKKKCPQCGSIL